MARDEGLSCSNLQFCGRETNITTTALTISSTRPPAMLRLPLKAPEHEATNAMLRLACDTAFAPQFANGCGAGFVGTAHRHSGRNAFLGTYLAGDAERQERIIQSHARAD
jgi:hypothetical protein